MGAVCSPARRRSERLFLGRRAGMDRRPARHGQGRPFSGAPASPCRQECPTLGRYRPPSRPGALRLHRSRFLRETKPTDVLGGSSRPPGTFCCLPARSCGRSFRRDALMAWRLALPRVAPCRGHRSDLRQRPTQVQVGRRRRPGSDCRGCDLRGEQLLAQRRVGPRPVAVERPARFSGERKVHLVAVEPEEDVGRSSPLLGPAGTPGSPPRWPPRSRQQASQPATWPPRPDGLSVSRRLESLATPSFARRVAAP